MEWYRPGHNRSPWSNSTNHACATTDTYFYTSGAAFNPGPDNDSTGYDVRLQAVGIASGDMREFVVHVPFQRSPRRDHSEFDVRRISATENGLSIILGTRTEQGVLEFDVGSIVNKVAPANNQ